MAWDQKRRPPSEYLHPKKQQRILAKHGYVCHLCGHPGATEVDHIIGWAEWERTDISVHDASNLAPAHGTPCPVCDKRCHEDKSKAEAARGVQRKRSKLRYPEKRHPGLL